MEIAFQITPFWDIDVHFKTSGQRYLTGKFVFLFVFGIVKCNKYNN